VTLLGECDVICAELSRRAGWRLNHPMIPEGEQVDIEAVDQHLAYHRMIRQVLPDPVKVDGIS
jgi:hypothetical protein